MSLNEYKYLWEDQRDTYVLVKVNDDYAIIDKKDAAMLIIEDSTVDKLIIDKMLKNGSRVYESINELLDSNKDKYM